MSERALRWSIRPVRQLHPEVIEGMWRLFSRYYVGANRRQFDQDLSKKDHVILLRLPGDATLRGFSTLARDLQTVDRKTIATIFSGDTIVDRDHWGAGALQRAFGVYMLRTRLRYPLRRTYWFLISKGYKTYLLLTRNFPHHWPRHDRPTPPREQGLINELARRRFGDAWREQEGLVRYDTPRDRLREDVAPVDERLRGLPEVAFFARANPGYASGDELACLGRVQVHLLLRYMWRRVRRKRAAQRPQEMPQSSHA